MKETLALLTILLLTGADGCKLDLEGNQLPKALQLTKKFSESYGAHMFQEARQHAEDAFLIWEKHRGPRHVDTAVALSNLALANFALKENALAEEKYRAALSIYEFRREPQHPDIANCLAALAQVLAAEGRPEEARKLLLRALAIREHLFSATDQRTIEIAHQMESLDEAEGSP